MNAWGKMLIEAGRSCKEIREASGLTQIDAAQMFGRTQATISRFESGSLDSEYLYLSYMSLKEKE